MKKTTFIIIFLLCFCDLYALKPKRMYGLKPKKMYDYKPNDFGFEYLECKVETADGISINTWHLISQNRARDKDAIIIAYADAGNMGDWLSLAKRLVEQGLDVFMFDYRGFGDSGEFEINQNQLYYAEFVKDLSSVVDYAKKSCHGNLTLFGLSMGTIIATEYLKADINHNIHGFIADGFICNPAEAAQKIMAAKGREILLPKLENNKVEILENPFLLLGGKHDFLCDEQDIKDTERLFPNISISLFDCGHLQALGQFPEEYILKIQTFLNNY